MPGIRSGHFDKHVVRPMTRTFTRCEVPTEQVYELLADRFAGRSKHAQLYEGVVNSVKRPWRNGRIVRYDQRTEEFLVIDPALNRAIVTYFLPRPRSKDNPYATNLEYFKNNLIY
jgi:hypothetical protein